MGERVVLTENDDITEENKRLKLEIKKLTRQLNLANDNMDKFRIISSAKENLSAVIAAEKSVQEKQLQVIMENSLDVIILFDRSLNFLLSTQSFLKLAGVPTVGFLKGKSFRQVFSSFAQVEWITHIESYILLALETNQIQYFEERIHNVAQQDMRDYSIIVIPYDFSREEYDGLLVILHDITERIEMESKLVKALDDAMSASKAKGDFLSNMSHEMRTPMNAIIGMTAIGKRANDVSGKNLALSKISDAASHLLGIINDVLDMAKIEADKLELVPVEYSFENMLQKAASVINYRVDEKQQQFTIRVDKAVPRFIVGDDQRLAQVITNLLSNAVKFTPEGGKINLNISLLEEIDNNCLLQIEVIDNGIGISPENRDKLFRAFEQADSGTSREYGGTGLGLVISKRIIELMGGEMWVESEEGKGSRFVFTFNAKRGNKSSQSLLLPGVKWNNVRIIAVDDMIETRNQFADLFNQLDINCDIAANAYEALDLIEENGEYDIYFIHSKMSGMDGIELTRQIKSRSDKTQPVIIMSTAPDWDDIRSEATHAGVDKHLPIPIFSSGIIDCVNEFMGVESIREDAARTEDIYNFKGKRILLAEDMEINREILIALLDGTEIIVDCAENGLEALEMIEATPDKYDIVFMDMQMPKMDGLEATRRIRALPALQNVDLPIIAMTANVFKDDIEACLEAGMSDHIGKPLDIIRVIDILHKYLLTG
jgi:PAS domain S-box-containing protein